MFNECIATLDSSPQECYKIDPKNEEYCGVWLTDDLFSPSGWGWYFESTYEGGIYWGYDNARDLADEICSGYEVSEEEYAAYVERLRKK